MKVKDFEPKYRIIELIIDKENKFCIAMITMETFKREYPEYEIESVKDYEDTETTSIVIKKVEE